MTRSSFSSSGFACSTVACSRWYQSLLFTAALQSVSTLVLGWCWNSSFAFHSQSICSSVFAIHCLPSNSGSYWAYRIWLCFCLCIPLVLLSFGILCVSAVDLSAILMQSFLGVILFLSLNSRSYLERNGELLFGKGSSFERFRIRF